MEEDGWYWLFLITCVIGFVVFLVVVVMGNNDMQKACLESGGTWHKDDIFEGECK